MGHTARSDHSGHDLPHTEVRVCRVAPIEQNKRLEEEGGGWRWVRKKKETWRHFSHSKVCVFRERGSVFESL